MKTVNDLVEGLIILQSLYGNEPYSAHGGKLFVGSYEPERLLPEQVSRLSALGWLESEESWALFVD